MKIVELQEKLDLSYRKNEEIDEQRQISEAKQQVLEKKLRQVLAKTASKLQNKDDKEGLSNLEEMYTSQAVSKANGKCFRQGLHEKILVIAEKL